MNFVDGIATRDLIVHKNFTESKLNRANKDKRTYNDKLLAKSIVIII